MFVALIILVPLFLVSTACAGGAWLLAWRLTPEKERPGRRRWLGAWAVRGLAAPVMIWASMNLGWSWSLPPFMPQVQYAQYNGTAWFPEFLVAFALGLFVIASYWTAATLGWSLVRAGAGLPADKETRSDFKVLCITCCVAMFLPALGLWLLGGWSLLGLAVTAMLAPIAGYAPKLVQSKKLPPMYARAVARIKFGKYADAEWEIIRELEKHEDDFDGWIMLAELYANQFHDLAEAEQTIVEICDHPKTTPSQISVALHKLADWQLKLGDDPAAARRSLQAICDRLPGSHLARMAQLRINQLPATALELRAQRTAQPIPLPALGDSFDQAAEPGQPELDQPAAVAMANACVETLRLNPNNTEAREKLARLLVERLDQANQGLEQLSLLLAMPDPDESRRAHWLALAAAWQFRYRQDPATGRKLLEQLVSEFPQSVEAFAARRRLGRDRVPARPPALPS